MPTVSVIIPAYNHERYIAECLESVLGQTFQDFEIVITDDASADRTVAIIETFQDPRIRLFRHATNQGASLATNKCLQQARGKYIAMLSSDDAWYPNKLEVQVAYLEAHPEIGAVFGKAEWVDETGAALTSARFPFMDVFEVGNRSRFAWLNHFFHKGNCLCHPCSLIRRECYEQVGQLNPLLASVPDFDLWVRLCLKYEIHVLDQKLIRFRRMSTAANASGDSEENRVRNRYELRRILDHFLTIPTVAEFNAIFPAAALSVDLGPAAIHYALAKLAIQSGADYKVLWGLDVLYGLLQHEPSARLLAEHFHFTPQAFIKRVGQQDVFRVSGMSSSLAFHPPVNQPGFLGSVLFLTKAYLRGLYKALIRFIAAR